MVFMPPLLIAASLRPQPRSTRSEDCQFDCCPGIYQLLKRHDMQYCLEIEKSIGAGQIQRSMLLRFELIPWSRIEETLCCV